MVVLRNNNCLTVLHVCAAALVLLAARAANAEKKLIYDEERGVIFADPAEMAKAKTAAPKLPSAAREAPPPAAAAPRPRRSAREDIHANRQKDPPEIYFQSGLEYFKNGDYENALRNFLFADSADPQPKYALWSGKTYRQLGKSDQMLFQMNKILNTSPESDVADDALFEIAFFSQTDDDYEGAALLYARLAEQYPFGRSFSSNQEFREIARQQINAMQSEVIGTLGRLGYAAGDLSQACSAFQKSWGLAVSGQPDAETVKAIKAADRQRTDQESRAAGSRASLKETAKYGVGAAAILLVILILLLVVTVKTRARARQIATLCQTLSDLKTSSL